MPTKYKLRDWTETAWLTYILSVLALVMLSVGTINQSIASTRNDIQRLVLEEAMNSGVPASLALAVAKVGSNFQVNALSSNGAVGVMQIMPAIAILNFGIKPEELWSARLNVQLGIDFLETLIKRYNGRWDLALSHYRSGIVKNTPKNLKAISVSQTYVAAVLNWQERYESTLRNEFSQNNYQTLSDFPLGGYIPLYPGKHKLATNPLRFSWTNLKLHATWNDLDDFNESLNVRLIEASDKLDDFSMLETGNEF